VVVAKAELAARLCIPDLIERCRMTGLPSLPSLLFGPMRIAAPRFL